MAALTVAALVVGAALVLLTAPPASAHATLVGSSPEDGQTVGEAPGTVRLRFDEPVQSSFAQVVVSSADGTKVQKGKPSVVDGDVAQRLGALPEAEGSEKYTVGYRVVSSDGHPVTGELTFTYDPAAGRGSGSGSGSGTGGRTGDGGGADSHAGHSGHHGASADSGFVADHGLHIGAGAVLLAGAGGVLWWRSRESR